MTEHTGLTVFRRVFIDLGWNLCFYLLEKTVIEQVHCQQQNSSRGGVMRGTINYDRLTAGFSCASVDLFSSSDARYQTGAHLIYRSNPNN